MDRQESDGTLLWSWVEVAQWLWQNELIQEQAACEAKEVAAINSVLDWLHQRRMEPALIDLIWKHLNKEMALQP